MKTLTCRNPRCRREFTPDSAHRSLPYCCPMCQSECTPRPTKQVKSRGDFGVSVTLTTPITRKADGGTRRAKTE